MKRLFYIDYPQEHVEGKQHTYQCAYCKVLTTTINGKLEGHLSTCAYRRRLEDKGFELEGASREPLCPVCDESD